MKRQITVVFYDENLYTDYIYSDSLKAVRPAAVKVIGR